MYTKENIGRKVQEYIDITFHGNQSAAGRALGLHSTTLSGAIKGKWLPNEKVVKAMGLERVDVRDDAGHIVNTYYEEAHEVKLRKFNQLYRGMTTISKKIYDVVSEEKPMTLQQIVTEFGKTGSAQFAVIEACLNQMRESGLLNRNGKGEYLREPIETPTTAPEAPASIEKAPETPPSPDVPPPPEEKPMVKPNSTPPVTLVSEEPNKSPLDVMAELSERANKGFFDMQNALIKVQSVMNDFERLSADIEAAAIEIQEKFEADAKELNELREWKASIKKLMGA